MNAKYSEALAQECLEWIKMITSENIDVSGDMDNFFETLKDGTLLCRYGKNFRIYVWMVKMRIEKYRSRDFYIENRNGMTRSFDKYNVVKRSKVNNNRRE